MKNKNFIIAIITILSFTTYIVIYKNKKIKTLKDEKSILIESVSNGLHSATNTIDLFSKMKSNNQMTKDDLKFVGDSIFIYNDSMIFYFKSIK